MSEDGLGIRATPHTHQEASQSTASHWPTPLGAAGPAWSLFMCVFRVSSQLKSRFETDGLLSYETVDALQQARDTQTETPDRLRPYQCCLCPDGRTRRLTEARACLVVAGGGQHRPGGERAAAAPAHGPLPAHDPLPGREGGHHPLAEDAPPGPC